MSAPTCQSCWLGTLSNAERERVLAEAVTSCIHLCPEHQSAMDRMLRDLPTLSYIKAATPRTEGDVFRAYIEVAD